MARLQPQKPKEENNNEEGRTGDIPDYASSEHGAAAWVNTDTNGNEYISVALPLGLGKVNLFPVDKKQHEE